MSQGRGRPPVFSGHGLNHVVSLIRNHGQTGAQKILAANPGTKLAQLRNKNLFPKPVKVSLVTLVKYTRLGGVQLQLGRRAA